MTVDQLATDQALAMRSHYARVADVYGERCVDALLEGRYTDARRCALAYHYAASCCRELGERVRAR